MANTIPNLTTFGRTDGNPPSTNDSEDTDYILNNNEYMEELSGEMDDYDEDVTTTTNRPQPSMIPPPPGSVNTTLLAAVLGSVAFVCLSAIVIVWLVRRGRRNKSQSHSESAEPNNAQFLRNNWKQASGLYESVGPALPDRPLELTKSQQKSNQEKSKSAYVNEEDIENGYVKMQTHSVIHKKQAVSTVSGPIVKLAEDEDAYLKPVKPEDTTDSKFIDEYNYLNFNFVGEKMLPRQNELEDTSNSDKPRPHIEKEEETRDVTELENGLK